jgi:hypothetical protein
MFIHGWIQNWDQDSDDQGDDEDAELKVRPFIMNVHGYRTEYLCFSSLISLQGKGKEHILRMQLVHMHERN